MKFRIVFAVAVALCVAPLAQAQTLQAQWNLEEGTGTTSADSSGNGRDLTFTGGGVTWTATTASVPTGSNFAVRYAASPNSDHLVATGYKGIDGTGSRTVSTWVNLQGTGAAQPDQTFVNWGVNNSGEKYTFRTNDNAGNGLVGGLRVEVNGGYIIGNTDIRDSDFHHVVAVLSDNGAATNVTDHALYVDGRRQLISGSQGQTIDTNTTAGGSVDVRLGEDFNAAGRQFRGIMDQAAIYSDALTSRDVRTLATGSPNAIATLNYDASVNPGGAETQNVFDNQTGDPDRFDLQTPGTLMTRTPVKGLGVTAYWNYDGTQSSQLFDASAGAAPNGFNDIPGDATVHSASFLTTIRGGDRDADQVIFETGGNGIGTSLTLSGDTLQFTVKDGGVDALATADLSNLGVNDFIQVLGVIDLDLGQIDLYVDGALSSTGTDTYAGIDWAGGDNSGLAGQFGGSIGGDGGALNLTSYGNFIGDIGDFSYFTEALDATDAQNLFAAATVPEPTSIAIWTLLGLAFAAFGWKMRRTK